MQGEMLESKKFSAKPQSLRLIFILALVLNFLPGRSILFSSSANAEMGTVKVLDGQGLVRAIKEISGQGSVSIESTAGDLKITLQCIDRFQPERAGELVGNQIVFKNIGPGTWRITGSQEGITKVTITAE